MRLQCDRDRLHAPDEQLETRRDAPSLPSHRRGKHRQHEEREHEVLALSEESPCRDRHQNDQQREQKRAAREGFVGGQDLPQ